MPSVHSFTVLPVLPDALKELNFIVKNMFWSWNHEFVNLFKRIDSELWESCSHNPVKLLGTVSQERLNVLSKNKGFLCELQRAAEKLKTYLNGAKWFDTVTSGAESPVIAYFSAEFGINESLPIYSGGLGILAGDHLKSASDMGIPLTAVGLMYQKGYFKQYLNIDGWQQEIYTENNFYNMPVEPVTDEHGEPVTISIELANRNVTVQIWRINVGRVKLYLLDSNVAENSFEDRVITSNLYGGDREMRIRQEILLGIGGLRALMAMGIEPTVCHMNEGHAAFMALERIRNLREKTEMTFDEAVEATKCSNVFTVHTPVKAGNDEFTPEMMDKYFCRYYSGLGLDKEQFLALGRCNTNDKKETFKMPVLALRLSAYKNGVSKLHGKISREMWADLWPDIPVNEVPIISITNGVHIKTWLSEEMNLSYERYLGANWTEGIVDESVWGNIDNIPDEELWRTHQRAKERLVSFARKRLKEQMKKRGSYHTELNWADEVLDPDALTIGFARRFATYKRGYLLLKDPQRFVNILNNSKKPVQIVFAGKAHPRDTEGKEIIRQIIHFASQYEVRRRIVFLEDYDIDVARVMVQGVDVWLNTPRPPMEASGTSGMKAAFNGALNFSTMDGWWCEGYTTDNGWAIGAGEKYDDAGYQDVVESQSIYNILENEIAPLFYTRSVDNLPRAWIKRMKNCIKQITPRFNTNRMLSEYTRKFYIPAASKGKYLSEEGMSGAKSLSAWKLHMKESWHEFDIKEVHIETLDEQAGSTDKQLKVGSRLAVKALVKLGQVHPDNVSIQIYHGKTDSWGNISDGTAVEMCHQHADSDIEHSGEYWFTGIITCTTSGRQGFAVRLLPKHPDMTNPYELGLILWEKTNTAAAVGKVVSVV